MRRTIGWLVIAFLLVFVAVPGGLRAKNDFEIFDGRAYNGKFYPRIDIIEWNDRPGDPTRMEFHVYWKGKPLDLGFSLEQKDKKKVMLVNYHIKDRDETLCRRVLAPAHFSEGFLVYRDTSDFEMDSVIVTMQELPPKKGRELIKPKAYASCEMPKGDRQPADAAPGAPAAPHDQVRPKGDKGAIKPKGAAVPFGDW